MYLIMSLGIINRQARDFPRVHPLELHLMTLPANKRKPGRPARTDLDASASIRSAALNVFAQKGFDRASIVDIANAANVAKPLIHYHYATKEVL